MKSLPRSGTETGLGRTWVKPAREGRDQDWTIIKTGGNATVQCN